MKKLTIGILAHVDAGKTTLSEGLLYAAGALRTLGRVDHGDAFLDTEALERERGITIFAKQAVLDCGGTHITLLDTPGHVDFSAEAERTLQVLDYAVLVISGTDGVQSHTETLWRLLRRYHIPTFVFINKMDRDRADFDMAFNGLSSVLGMKPVTLFMPVMTDGVFTGVVDILGGKALMFGENGAVTEALIPDAIADEAALLHDTTVENIAESDEELMEKYLEEGSLSEEDLASGLRKGVLNASLVPVVVGS